MGAPLPNELPKECQKATKILNSFVDPIDGLDKLVPISVLSKARGFAIFSVIRVGFILSARAGSGIVIARTDTAPDGSGGHWTAPTAIGIAGLGGGFNAGAQIIDCLVVLNSSSAVRAFSTTGSLQLGGNLSVAVGPLGRSAEASGSLNFKGSVAAMFSYSRAKGLYGGVSLEGTVLVERTDANIAAYGKGATAASILGGRVEPPLWSRGLIDAIEKLTKTGHLANRLNRARQEEIDREYGTGLESGGRQSYSSPRRSSDLGRISSAETSSGLGPAPKTRREREGSGSLWDEDENEQDTLASLSRRAGRIMSNASAASAAASSSSLSASTAFPRRDSAATGTLFDDDFSNSFTPTPPRPTFAQSSSTGKIRTRGTPPPPLSTKGDYAFGSDAGGSFTNSPSAGRRTPAARPPSSASGGRRTPGGSMSLFSRSSNRTPAATTQHDPYAHYFNSNLDDGNGPAADSSGMLASTPGGTPSKRPGFLRHRTRSSVGSKKSFSLMPAAFRRDTPPVQGGSQALAEEELERKLRLYDEDHRSGGGMERSGSAAGTTSGTPAYANFNPRRKPSPGPAAFQANFQQDSSGMGFTSGEDDDYGAPTRSHAADPNSLHESYEERLARDMALARRASPPSSSAWPRSSEMMGSSAGGGRNEHDDDDDLRRIEIIARRQRAILDAEERGESGRDSLDEFDRELQQERARLSSNSRYARGGAGGGAGFAGTNPNPNSTLARSLLSRTPSFSGNGASAAAGSNSDLARSGSFTLNGGTSRKISTGRDDPFAQLYASQTGASSIASPASAAFGSGNGLNRRLSSVRSSGETSMFDSSASQAQSQLTPASSVGGLPQLDKGDGISSGGGGAGAGLVLALFPFQAQMPTDLGFAKGDVVRVTKRTASRDDWWEGINASGQTGSFPANYTSDL
ncbi:unnamed protein product [Tilletia controversa]|uniref:SH3 domain-containing protein n=1 Tax=Tilletia controversa TaxID=13291 RepID=A0A8X7SXH6_9BASI|nr:hypothetical protein A4X06_0g4170 [Tilletia controversa]CAD6939507.1 unnamed protein product [Tilletia controversa]CAD6984907.1 unnamed protein product [Tilletia controversa]